VVAVVAVIVIIARHLPQAAAIDLESLPAEQEAAMKAALMERRLKRKLAESKNRLLPMLRRAGGMFFGVFDRLYKRVQQLEQRYRRKPHSMTGAEQADVRDKIRDLSVQAQASVDAEEWSEAENRYIEILSWDPKNLETYAGLASVYLARKELNQAKETFGYLFRLLQLQKSGEEGRSVFSPTLTDAQTNDIRFEYVFCLQGLGALEEAKMQMDLVLAQDANNPKYLDKLIELSILIKDRKAAREAFDRLKAINPENQKLAIFEDKLRQL
jgi:tetratricopeptide (TPR) repeat protein